MFPVLRISGTPFERGQQYGAACPDLIQHSIKSYAELFAYLRGISWAEARREALGYAAVIEQFAAPLLEEMHGIAAGAQSDLADILALNARTELLAGVPSGMAHPNYRWAQQSNQAAGIGDHGECTALAVLPGASSDGSVWLAQNWDWSGMQRAACVVLLVQEPGKPALITLTEAGMLAKIGLNAAGVGVCLNILRSTLDGGKPGVPVHVLLRAVLGCQTASAAASLATSVAVSGSSHLLIADRQANALGVELTPAGPGVLTAQDGVLLHTNHCLAPETQPVASALVPTSSSLPRYERASEVISGQRGALDRAAIIALLRDETRGELSICRHPNPSLHPCDRTETVAAVLMNLSARTIEIAADIPSRSEFVPVAWI